MCNELISDRDITTVLADVQETVNVLSQVCKQRRTVVSKLRIYFPEHMIPRCADYTDSLSLFLISTLQWVRKGYPSKISDTADQVFMGGAIKIDSVQNVITLRSDLHDAWDNYEFGVDPNVSLSSWNLCKS
jgi:hypothetical protein